VSGLGNLARSFPSLLTHSTSPLLPPHRTDLPEDDQVSDMMSLGSPAPQSLQGIQQHEISSTLINTHHAAARESSFFHLVSVTYYERLVAESIRVTLPLELSARSRLGMAGCHESCATDSSLEAQMRTLPSGVGSYDASANVSAPQSSETASAALIICA
jgi:hypothetical protein